MLRADGFTPLFFARDRATAKLLVDEGADVGFNRNNCAYQLFCRFLLTLAAANTPAGPRQPALTCLLAVGWSPLHYAAHHNMIALTEVLLENGADVHSKTGGACVSARPKTGRSKNPSRVPRRARRARGHDVCCAQREHFRGTSIDQARS